MYIERVHLRNIACFEEFVADFTQAGEPCRWIVLLGENGTGKSTILQMMALSLLGRDMVYEIARGVDWTKFVRRSAIKGRVDITLLATSADGRRRNTEGECQDLYLAAFELGRTIRTGVGQDIEVSKEDYTHLNETLYADRLTGGWVACGYGPWRRLPRTRPMAQMLKTSRRKPYRFATMFDEESALTVVGDWLVDLEFQRLKEPDNQSVHRSFDLAVQALEKVLPGVKFKSITSEGDVLFEEGGVSVSIDHLSDGYRGTVAWVGDLVRRLIDAFPRAKNPLEAQGVVLVDELDIHLHPKWQRSIVEQIRDLFPNLQFIVSSHSPFVAQDMRPEDKIIVLEKRNGKVIAREGTDSVKGWRVDQILTSYLFDLETTRDISIAAAEREYQKLLDSRAVGRLTPEEKHRLGELRSWLQENRSLPGETPEENELYDVAQSLVDLLDEYLEAYD